MMNKLARTHALAHHTPVHHLSHFVPSTRPHNPRPAPMRRGHICAVASPLLPALLRDNERFSFEHGPGFANHNSMGLIALAALGADHSCLNRFYRGHAPHQSLARPAPTPFDDATWESFLGRGKHAAAFLSFFLRQAETRTSSELLDAFLPRLMGGVGAGGFHGILRLAYAVLLQRELGVPNSREVAHALAYLASGYLKLGPPASLPEACHTLIARLGGSADVHRGDAPSLLAPRMEKEAHKADFNRLVGTPLWEDDALRQLAAFAADAHIAGNNIASLHMVSGMHAMRILWPHCGPPQPALAALWRALAALYMTAGAPIPQACPADDTVATWEALCEQARAVHDVHVIKLVYSCKEESATYGADALYLFMAARALAAR